MEKAEGFNLHQTIETVGQACQAVICHVFFDAAIHGLIIAVLFAAIGFILLQRKQRLGKPFISVGRRLAILCVILTVPGILALLVAGKLPSTGVFSINSMGFVAFWSLICVHLSVRRDELSVV